MPLPIPTYILGIETSCDETSAAIVSSNGIGLERLVSHTIYSQLKEHADYGGVVPEIAARAHMDILYPLIQETLNKAHLSIHDMSAFAATCGPGLIGGLIVGALAAKTLAMVHDKPFIAINHLAAHAQVCRLVTPVDFPFLLLLVSGGHCQFVQVNDIDHYTLLGQTLDDSAGEVFDKIARLLNIDGGGAAIEKLAQDGNPARFPPKIPLKDRANCDMSFSGLKTFFRLLIQKMAPLSLQDKRDIAACLQNSIAEALALKAHQAFLTCSMNSSSLATTSTKEKRFVMAGGVAANQMIRKTLKNVAEHHGFQTFFPPVSLCTDNGAMVAWLGLEKYQRKQFNDLTFSPNPRWSLESI